MSRLGTAALVALGAVLLQGCGNSEDSGSGTTTQAPPSGPPAPYGPTPMGDFRPLRAVSYTSLPCTAEDFSPIGGKCMTALPAHDMMQEGYSAQWGPDGRDDLGMVKTLGGNAVRLYHSLGSETKHDHGKFLDRAQEIGLHVIPAFNTQNRCPGFDCFDTWKAAATAAFANGFMDKDKKDYHSAVSMLVLLDTPDNLNFAPDSPGGPAPVTQCKTVGEVPVPQCRVKAAISALDGVLAAEQEAGIKDAKVNLTISWTFTPRDSIDGKVTGVDAFTYGFQDMVAAVADPKVADYAPRTSQKALQDAFDARWTHSITTSSNFDFIKEKIGGQYAAYEPKPWFISEYRLDPLEEKDLQEIDDEAKQGFFMGAVAYQFLEDYQVNGTNTLGLFGIDHKWSPKWTSGKVYEQDVYRPEVETPSSWDVRCLTDSTDPSRVKALITAWGGEKLAHGSCWGNASAVESESLQLVV